MRTPRVTPIALALLVSLAGCLENPSSPPPTSNSTSFEEPGPHVTVGILDSGINPYHAVFRDANRTTHPCTYLAGYPCDVPALNLSIGQAGTLAELVDRDTEEWSQIEPGDWYWIPGTRIVALGCSDRYEATVAQNVVLETDHCGLSDTDGHGTGVTGQVALHAPAASLVVAEGEIRPSFLQTLGVPIDVQSRSIGASVPVPGPAFDMNGYLPAPVGVLVNAAGNDPAPSPSDSTSAHPRTITVGGAHGPDQFEVRSRGPPDAVQDFCAMVADAATLDGFKEACGTSFSAPHVAALLAQLILDIREATGATGLLAGDVLEPSTGLTVEDVRDLLNGTATHDPDHVALQGRGSMPIPFREEAAMMHFGWGYVTAGTVEHAVDAWLTNGTAPERPGDVTAFMTAVHAARSAHQMPVLPEEHASSSAWP